MIWAAIAAAIAIAAVAGGRDHWKELVRSFRKAVKKRIRDKDRREVALAVLDAANPQKREEGREKGRP